mmetsp:Transcript_116242/g.335756  ORF Transcript_116242/g.335756 Transcript_116242/m.335756 type:complete len:226 (+) Transcript_116242:870-1547(+)
MAIDGARRLPIVQLRVDEGLPCLPGAAQAPKGQRRAPDRGVHPALHDNGRGPPCPCPREPADARRALLVGEPAACGEEVSVGHGMAGRLVGVSPPPSATCRWSARSASAWGRCVRKLFHAGVCFSADRCEHSKRLFGCRGLGWMCSRTGFTRTCRGADVPPAVAMPLHRATWARRPPGPMGIPEADLARREGTCTAIVASACARTEPILVVDLQMPRTLSHIRSA